MATHPTFTFAVALAAGVFAQVLARHLRVPGIVLLLAAGAALGPELLDWVRPADLGGGLFALVDIGVAVILFEGGLNLELRRMRQRERAIRMLITVGALVTLAGGTLAVRGLLDWSWPLAFLFGSLVVVTGPTVVTPLVRDLRLRPRLKTVLEAEGVLIDPIGAVLAVLVLQVALVPAAATLAAEAGQLLMRIGFGVGAGAAAAFVLGGLLRVRGAVPLGLGNIVVLASVVLLFGGCDAVLSHSGVMAVTIAGVVVGNLGTAIDRDLREFKDQLTILLVGLLFVLLAADVSLDDVAALGWPGATVVALLILVVRPLAVWLSTLRSKLNVRERLFVAWMAPRGIVAAAVASLTALALTESGHEGGAELRALVFLTIAGTVTLAGLTAAPVASLLNVRLPRRERVAILGANGLGLALGRRLKEAGKEVVFLDSDPKRCRAAEDAGLSVAFGDALEERVLARAQFELVGTAIGLTQNEHLNTRFVLNAHETFGVPSSYVALSTLPAEKSPATLERHDALPIADGALDVGRWDVRFRHGDAEIVELVREERDEDAGDDAEAPADPPPSRYGARSEILLVRRGDETLIMTPDLETRPGDLASVAIFVPERAEALTALARLGWVEPA